MKFPVDAPRKNVVKAFELLGFVIVREGNHIILERRNPDGTRTPLVIPNHRTIKSSTLRLVLTQSGIDRSQFLEAYAKVGQMHFGFLSQRLIRLWRRIVNFGFNKATLMR